MGIETQNVNCKTLGIGANRFSLLRQMRHGILGIAPSHLVKRVQPLQVKYLLFKEIIFLPSYHKTVTGLFCAQVKDHLQDIRFGIQFFVIVRAAYRCSCSMTSDLKGSCPSRNSLWNSLSAIDFFIFASTTSGRFRQITKATVWIFSSWSPITV